MQPMHLQNKAAACVLLPGFATAPTAPLKSSGAGAPDWARGRLLLLNGSGIKITNTSSL